MYSKQQEIPSSKSEVIKSITKHQVDIAVLKEREEQLLAMIKTLERLVPFAIVWYMWRLAIASRAETESQYRIEQEAKQTLSRLLTSIEELKKEMEQIKLVQDSASVNNVPFKDPALDKKMIKVPTDTTSLSDHQYQQIDPSLKPGSHVLLTEPKPPKVGKVPLKRHEKGSKPMTRSGTTLASKAPSKEPSRSSRDGSHLRSRSNETSKSPREDLSEKQQTPMDVKPTSSASRRKPSKELPEGQTSDMAEASKSRTRVVREIIEIQHDGKPPEKYEIPSAIDAPQAKAVEDLISRLDRERDQLQEEMDRIFGPLPEAVGKPGKLGTKQLLDSKDKEKSQPGEDTTPKSGSPGGRKKPVTEDMDEPESWKPTPTRSGGPGGRRVPYTEDMDEPESGRPASDHGGSPYDSQGVPYGQRSPGQGSPYNRGAQGQGAPYDQGRPGSPYSRGSPGEERALGSPGQGSPYGQGAPGQGSPYGQGGPGQGLPYGQGAPGQRSPYGQGGPGQGSPYGQGAPGQRSPYGQGGPGQGTPYGQGAPGQRSPYNQWAPGQVPPYGQGAPGQRSPYDQGTPGQGSASGQAAPGQRSPYGQGTPGQRSPYDQRAPGQVPPYTQAAPGEGPPYGQRAPAQGSPRVQWSPEQGSPYDQDVRDQGADFAQPWADSPAGPPDEMKESIERIEARLDKIARAVERALKDSPEPKESIDSDKDFPDFHDELQKIQEKVAEGMQKIQEIIDREMTRMNRRSGF